VGSLQAQEVIQIDPFGGNARRVPDLDLAGGVDFLASDEIIDVVILGDGYLAGERNIFLQHAQDFYDGYFHPTDGLVPYTIFSEAFRVRAVWTPSDFRADAARDSYYRTKVSCSDATTCTMDNCTGGGTCWLTDTTADDNVFRNRVWASVNALGTPINLTRYPGNLSVAVGGGNIVPSMANNYSNLYLVLFIRADEAPPANGFPGDAFSATLSMCEAGINRRAACSSDADCPGSVCRRSRVAFAQEMPHEFGHAFGYLRDEYIANDQRGQTAPALNVPTGSGMSIFYVSNRGYTDNRATMPWAHLAPGGHYNPDPTSLVGNLFAGGGQELGVWHSEYKCMMNGAHDNYVCDRFTGAPKSVLRDDRHFCFWCEEILTLRILERTGQFERLAGSCTDLNNCGRSWWLAWDTVLRDRYYQRNDVPERVAERSTCYRGDCDTAQCQASCDRADVPDCLPSCELTEMADGVYVDSVDGAANNPGTRTNPVDTIDTGLDLVWFDGKALLFVNPGSYPEPTFMNVPVILRPGACQDVLIGR